MPITLPDVWDRHLIGDNIVWTHKLQIHCYACGKPETVLVSVFEGKFNEELEEEIITAEGTIKIYPTFAPSGHMEWKVPEGWTQITHLTSNFFPNETLTAIKMTGMDPFDAFEKWHSTVMTQFAEWVCPSDECFMDSARKVRAEFNAMKELAKSQVTKSQVATSVDGR